MAQYMGYIYAGHGGLQTQKPCKVYHPAGFLLEHLGHIKIDVPQEQKLLNGRHDWI